MTNDEIIREGRALCEKVNTGYTWVTRTKTVLRAALDALEEATKSLEIREGLIRKLREPTEEHRRWVSLMDGTPDWTRPMNVYYTPTAEVVVCGDPSDEPDDDESCHNCDAMGCTSGSHVIWRGTLASFWAMCEGHERAEAALAAMTKRAEQAEAIANAPCGCDPAPGLRAMLESGTADLVARAVNAEAALAACREERDDLIESNRSLSVRLARVVEGHKKAAASLAKAEANRDEARRMYCEMSSARSYELQKAGRLLAHEPRDACCAVWPDAADRLFPGGGK